MLPLVSVIVPVYNNETYVEKCIRSIMRQSYSNLEILVINDGSKDHSLNILEKLAEEDERIKLFDQENAGVSAARNKGLDHATGEFITFVDGDDYIDFGYISGLYQKSISENLDIVICGLNYVDELGNTLRTVIPGEYRRFENEEWTFRISAVCAHFYRRELWEKYQIRFLSGERGEDMPISLFFSAVCDKINVVQTAGYNYVQHSSSAMHNFKGLNHYSLPYHAIEQTLKKVQEIGIANSTEFYELFVMRIFCTCFFDLARGASREKMKELTDYMVRILNEYFPKYYKNTKASLFSKLDIPFVQKAAVKLLVLLVRSRLIYPVSVWMSK